MACGWKQLICCPESLPKVEAKEFHRETPVIATVPVPNMTTSLQGSFSVNMSSLESIIMLSVNL